MGTTVNLNEIIDFVKIQISDEVAIEVSQIDENSRFVDLGLDSISGIFVLDKIEEKYNLDLSPAMLLDHPTIFKFSQFLVSEISKEND